MSSTTIRYSGVPENSHSRGFTSGRESDQASGRSAERAADRTSSFGSGQHQSDRTADRTADFGSGHYSSDRAADSGSDRSSDGTTERGPVRAPDCAAERGYNRAPGSAAALGSGRAFDNAADRGSGQASGHASASDSGGAADLGYDHSSERSSSAREAVAALLAEQSATAAAAAAAAADFGLIPGFGGYYDSTGRRLFLLDGSPDPMTPGTYRYRVSPDLCDLGAPESDPSSPRYEPPHLRHQPGDDWEIGGKPYDPDDPGPYGNPLWRPDTRTGRHRRGELPDPISPPERTDTERPAPPSDATDDDEDQAGRQGGQSGARLPIAPDRPRPSPRDRSRFWSEADSNASEPAMRDPHVDHAVRNRDLGPSEPPYQFSKLREAAWDRFQVKSAELAAAHQHTHALLQREGGWAFAMVLQFFHWLIAVVKGSAKVGAPQGPQAPHAHPPLPHPRPHPTQETRPEQRPASRPGRMGRAEAQRRTSLALDSSRLAAAVRGVQRGRAAAGAAVASETAHARGATGSATGTGSAATVRGAGGASINGRVGGTGAAGSDWPLFGGAAWA